MDKEKDFVIYYGGNDLDDIKAKNPEEALKKFFDKAKKEELFRAIDQTAND